MALRSTQVIELWAARGRDGWSMQDGLQAVMDRCTEDAHQQRMMDLPFRLRDGEPVRPVDRCSKGRAKKMIRRALIVHGFEPRPGVNWVLEAFKWYRDLRNDIDGPLV